MEPTKPVQVPVKKNALRIVRYSGLVFICLFVLPSSTWAQLSPENNQIFTQATLGLDADSGDQFGSGFAVGDFNGDGYDDAAIAADEETIVAVDNAGAVVVILGSSSGLEALSPVYLHQNLAGVDDTSETGDLFGYSLVACDFDGNQLDDLAVGVPGENDPSGVDDEVGAVHIFYSAATGPTAADDFFYQDDVGGSAIEEADQFGHSLACGDFDRDGYDDLAVGTPWEDWFNYEEVGRVDVIYGSSTGLNPADTVSFFQGLPDLGDLEEYDLFGWSLTAGDFNDDTYDDLAVGSVGEDNQKGVAHIIYGSATGLDNVGADTFTYVDGCGGTASLGDRFANSLKVGDFNGDHVDDLALAVPERSVNGEASAGEVCVLQGDALGPNPPTFSVLFIGFPWQGVVEAEARLGWSLSSGDFDGDGFDDLAVGASWADSIWGLNTGELWIYHGSEEAFDPWATEHYSFVQNMVGGNEQEYDYFGHSLAAGNFNGDSADDLLIGVPFENLSEGWVHELFGQGVIFADGFESGDTSSWSSASP